MIKIKKGHHRSNEWLKFTFKKSFAYLFDFSFAIYHLEGDNQFDWNKLFGITGCLFPRLRLLKSTDERLAYCDLKIKVGDKYLCFFTPVHWNSCRIGWRYNESQNGLFQVTPYVYLQGYRLYDYETITLLPNNEVQIYLTKTRGSYLINISDKPTVCIPSKNSVFGFTCTCYFGGNKTAPRNLEIERI